MRRAATEISRDALKISFEYQIIVPTAVSRDGRQCARRSQENVFTYEIRLWAREETHKRGHMVERGAFLRNTTPS